MSKVATAIAMPSCHQLDVTWASSGTVWSKKHAKYTIIHMLPRKPLTGNRTPTRADCVLKRATLFSEATRNREQSVKLKLLTMLAGASLFASSAWADTITYSFLSQGSSGQVNAFFAMESATVTAATSVTPTFCLMSSACSTVTFNPTSAFDQVTLKNGSSYFFAANAFTTIGTYNSVARPGAASGSAQFSTQIVRAVSAAPEPAAWTLMIAGIGMAGYALRGSRRATRVSRDMLIA